MKPASGQSIRLVIYGAGGHGRVVADAAHAAGLHILGFVDDAPDSPLPLRWPMLENDPHQLSEAHWIVGIGDNRTREQIGRRLSAEARPLASVIHPRAIVSASAKLGQGVFIGPGAVVHSDAVLGDGAIVNSGAIVEHDCRLESYCHIAPGAVLGGGVTVGAGALVGLNASVLPCVSIGQYSIIGAGSVVTRVIPANRTAVGAPASIRT